MDKELRLDFNTSVKNYTHTQKELPNIISVQLKRIATEYTKFHMVIFYYDMNTENLKKKGILINTFYSINFLPFLLDNALHIIFSYCSPILLFERNYYRKSLFKFYK